jgi:integrase
MAKKAQPWYWEARNQWFVQIGGQRYFLGDHPEGLPPPKKGKRGWNSPKAIDDAYRRLLEGSPKPAATQEQTSGDSLAAVFTDFIRWCRENRAARTAERYKDFLESFVNHSEGGFKFGLIEAGKITTKHVNSWLSAQTDWGPTSKRNAITALMRGFNWAVRNRGLERNPIRGMEKPAAKTRTATVSPEEFETFIAAVKDQPFRDVLIVAYDTGCRPQELRILEARHVQADGFRAIIPAAEAKGGKHPRTIYFPTERSQEVLARLRQQHPEAALLQNRLGRPWTGMAIKCRMEDLDHVLGKRVRLYDLRHSFVTRQLKSGNDSHTVATLVGHRSTAMIHSTYSHVADDPQYMLKMAQRDQQQPEPQKEEAARKPPRRQSNGM